MDQRYNTVQVHNGITRLPALAHEIRKCFSRLGGLVCTTVLQRAHRCAHLPRQLEVRDGGRHELWKPAGIPLETRIRRTRNVRVQKDTVVG